MIVYMKYSIWILWCNNKKVKSKQYQWIPLDVSPCFPQSKKCFFQFFFQYLFFFYREFELKGLPRALLGALWTKQLVKQLTLWPKNMWKIIFKKLNKQKESKHKAYFGRKKQQFGEFSIKNYSHVNLKKKFQKT